MPFRDLSRDLAYAAGILRRQPFHALVQVTNRCNMRCSFCDFPMNAVAPSEELTLDDFRKIADDLTALGRFLISVEGGEPFLRPDLVEIVRIFGARHLPVLYTSGWFATPEAARALFEAGMIQVGVSIDFADAERHDRKRGIPGTFERAWRAVEMFRDAAPHKGRQVHVMTVLMEENRLDLERLLELSAARGVGHHVTLISAGGYRRGKKGPDRPPAEPVTARLLDLWRRFPHFRIFRDYLEGMDRFLAGERLPTCTAGAQSFNIDHQGNVSVCIEKIDRPSGNVRTERLSAIHARMRRDAEVAKCQHCWTACRGYNQALSGGGSRAAWMDLMTRMRSS